MIHHLTFRRTRPAAWRRATMPGAWSIALLLVVSGTLACAAANPVWARADLIENTAEGPAFNRCEVETALEGARTVHLRVTYGLARADSNSGWAGIRSQSGCAQAGPERAAAVGKPPG